MTARRCSYAGMQQQSQCVLANCGGSDAVKRGPIGAANIDLLRSTLYNHQQAQSNQRQQTPSRRTSRSSDVSTDMVCSQQSVLNVMDRFVKAVNNMDATVLVPSRLRDMDVTETTETGLSTGVGANNPLYFKGDLHSCFTMLHEAKNALLWGPSSPPSSHNPNVSCYSSSGSSTYGNQGSAYHNAALRVPSVTSQK
ncbi:mid1-interacting protein 1 isoform 1 [Tropilaelaps mercedesae]|uniref:Mid1-interacting protein 1 isoform 1 n=1 Tax=Tropilaelaps mercedesae TaxID=418985 RepID=A0A1V9XVY4_9ACAR|nr:mid1-interacting protein 1 isoform 1 [Tropilaelaps mercedesae]